MNKQPYDNRYLSLLRWSLNERRTICGSKDIKSPCTFFCPQITVVINKIEKNVTQRDLNFTFYEISEYVNFFCLKMFPSQKKAVSEYQLRQNDVACE